MLERLEAHGKTQDLLQAIAGIDRQAAASMLAEIGPDMSVFGSAHAFAARAGLSPSTNETVERCRHGAARTGSRHLRAALVEVAHGALRRHDRQFGGRWRMSVARRRRKRAIVAKAYQMSRDLYVILRAPLPYPISAPTMKSCW